MIEISTILLVIFVALSFLDGIYLHLWKFRLHERPESLYEHKTHTIRAILFAPILYFTYAINSGGLFLFTAAFLILIDFIVEIADALSERESRTWQGGLTKWEYLLHLMLTTVRIASITLILAAKPLSAWHALSPLILSTEYPELTSTIALNLIPGSILMAITHVVLILRPTLLSDIKCCGNKVIT